MVGDILLYRSNNQIVCHRLVRKVAKDNGYLFYTRGDASRTVEGPVKEEAFMGKVTGILRKGRIVDITGEKYCFINLGIVKFAPFLNKVTKHPIIYVRSFVKRWRNL